MLLYKGGNINLIGNVQDIFDKVEKNKAFTFSHYTTYGLGGGAKCAFFPKNLLEARAVYSTLKEREQPFTILGNGSNVLASDDGFDGYVICTSKMRGIIRIDGGTIFCLSGTTVGQLMRYCITHGLGGLEYLAGIPASVGGLACMNGGAGGKYISSNIVSVNVFDGTERNLSNKSCKFAYKQSTMRNINCLILGVFLSVFADLPANVSNLTRFYLSRRSSLPKGRSCGCVFKNPPGLSAGMLIEQCGLAGYGTRRAYVSPRHCNFIINDGASANEIKRIIDDVKNIVYNELQIRLEEEVVFVGRFT